MKKFFNFGSFFKLSSTHEKRGLRKKLRVVRRPSTKRAKDRMVHPFSLIPSLVGCGTHASLTLNGIFKEWLDFKSLSLKQQTLYGYVRQYRKHLSPILGNIPITEITTETIRQYVVGQKQAGAAPRSIVQYVNVLKSMLSFSHEKYGTKMPVFFKIRCDDKIKKPLTVDEHTALNQYLLDNINLKLLLILLMSSTGIRAGEACALRWENIHSNHILISETTCRKFDIETGSSTFGTSSPKTRSSLREVPIPSVIRPIIENFRKISKNQGFVCPNESGNVLNPKILRHHFMVACQKVGIEGATLHTLRHTFASRCADLDLPFDVICSILGHKIPGSTSPYIHPSLERLIEYAEKFNQFFE